ncbi:MAG: hypothetical protein SCALA702_27170 [Melioribacteraceae bacterium]|nr:MAG: hypothetical protein SCALA702_27170 [Melioribacteraceae bacterium]
MKENDINKERILIVEDEEDTCYILERLLSKNGYEVVSASNGEEALKIINNYNPKVIVADWTMPVMDGIELCNILKNEEKYKLIYYIILTARVAISDKVKGLDVGADDFLVKPVENEELLARIRSGVRIHNLQHELKMIEHSKAIIEMACTIGHKINNPLSSLIFSIQNLQSEVKDRELEALNEDLEIINQSVERIKTLTNELIKLDKPELINYTPDKKMIKLSN